LSSKPSHEFLRYLPVRKRNLIEKLLKDIKENCGSIMLTGSWARGDHHGWSDVDIIVITNDKTKEHVQRILTRHKRSAGFIGGNRPWLDIKLFSREEFIKLSNGPMNPFLFSCLKDGKIIYGKDFSKEIVLKPSVLLDNIDSCFQMIDEAIDLIKKKKMFPIICYFLYSCLRTFYHIDRIIDESRTSLDFERMGKKIFNSLWKKVKRTAYEVDKRAWRNWPNISIKVSKKDFKTIPDSVREQFLKSSQSIIEYGNKVQIKTLKWIKSYSISQL